MGYRSETYTNGVLVEVIDTRTLLEEQETILARLKIWTNFNTLKDAPIYKQINVLAGRESAEETTKINNIIANNKTLYDSLKSKVLAAKSLEQLDSIVRDQLPCLSVSITDNPLDGKTITVSTITEDSILKRITSWMGF